MEPVTGPLDLSRLESAVARLRDSTRSRSLRRVGLTFAVIVFCIGTVFAMQQVDLPAGGLEIRPLLLLVLAGIPATILLNTLEMELSAKLLGRRFGFLQALATTIMASAANMLPLPGAAMVRVAGLSGLGASVREGGSVTVALALLWVGVATAMTGAFLVAVGPAVAAIVIAGGLTATFVSMRMLVRTSGEVRLALAALVIRCAMVLVAVLRLLLCFQMLGLEASLGQIMVFAVSGVAGSAVSIVPAGLGVRELVSSAMAPLAGIAPAAAFLATALDRLVELFVLLALAVPLALLGRNGPPRSQEP